ncbi:MAG: trimethylamine methyltransferase family protein, partial [Verrucomicrobiota bacterium]
YVATSSLSGTRVNSELKHTPAVIAVMTEEFMRDVGANDILEAAAWSLSADPIAPGTGNNNGVNFRGLGAGFLHGSRIWSYAEMMLDCEIFSIIHKVMQGIVVDDENLALDVIANVGPGGNFLTQKHTRKHMRDIFLPQFMDRRPYGDWETKKDDARDWALEKARKTLSTHQPEMLDANVSKELARIIASAETL